VRALRLARHALKQLPAPLLGVSLAGWLLLTLAQAVSTVPVCISGAAPGADFDTYVAAFGIMLITMMPPLMSGPLLHVWRRSLTRRRLRAVLLFIAGFGLVWLMAGVPLMTMSIVIRGIVGGSEWCAIAFALAIALLWQASPLKQITLNRCHRRPPLAAFGLAAETDALRYGADLGLWCVGACWATMTLALSASGLAHVMLMMAVTIMSLAERVPAPQAAHWGAALPALPDDLRPAWTTR
jgi:predicted metal-binding membrane protein